MRRLKRLIVLPILLMVSARSLAGQSERDVPRTAQAEIARRGALVERVDGLQLANDASAAVAAAMQPPADDSHKWLFTIVTTRNCRLCEELRRDFETDGRLKSWVDTKDYTKSWAHLHVVQIEDQSQLWRWKDFRPSAFPTLIVQPPINGSWGDPHTIVYARQGYLKPAELDEAIRKAIQLYSAKAFPRRLAWEAKQGAESGGGLTGRGLLQETNADQSGGWTPPVPPPVPLAPLPSNPTMPNEIPPRQPDAGLLLSQLLWNLLGGPAMANALLLAILAWQIYRAVAKKQGIPLLVDDATAAQLLQFLESLRRAAPDRPLSVPSAGRAASNS